MPPGDPAATHRALGGETVLRLISCSCLLRNVNSRVQSGAPNDQMTSFPYVGSAERHSVFQSSPCSVVARLGETRWVQLLVPGCTGADRVLPEHLMSVQ